MFRFISFIILILNSFDIYSQCTSSFQSKDSSCMENLINFQFNGTGNQFKWDFGDPTSGASNTDTTMNPSHMYSNPGNYTVSLVVLDSNCTDTFTKRIYIASKLESNFTFLNNCVGLNTTLTPILTIDSLDSENKFLWDLGNSILDTNRIVNISFIDTGFKSITLISTSRFGCTDTFTKMIRIRPQPIAVSSTNSDCEERNINFSLSTNVESNTLYLWEFGDGSSSIQTNPTYQYSSSGTKTFKLTLTYPDSSKCTSEDKQILINSKPNSNFSISDSFQCFKNNEFCFIFEGKESNLIERSLLLGDGNQLNNISLSDSTFCYSYGDTLGGKYSITLEVVDSNGCSSITTKNNLVEVYPEFKVNFSQLSSTGCFQTPVNILNLSNQSPPKVVKYKWDLGDGRIDSSNWNISHVYSMNGVFNVTLTAENNLGCRDTMKRNGLFSNINFELNVRLDSANSYCRSNNRVYYSQTPVPSGSVLWIWGENDTTFYNWNASKKYLNPGTFFPRIEVRVGNCIKDSIFDMVTIVGPRARIGNIQNRFQCNIKDTVFAQNLSDYEGNASRLALWDFGDNFAPNCTSNFISNLNCRFSNDSFQTKHMYSKGQENCYNIRLIAYDTITGCADTTFAPVALMPPKASADLTTIPPLIGAQLNTNFGCLGEELNKAIIVNLNQTQPSCIKQNWWVMWDSARAAASGNFNSYWENLADTHFYAYDQKPLDTNGRVTIGVIIQNGLDSNGLVCRDTAWYNNLLTLERYDPRFSSDYNPNLYYCRGALFNFRLNDTIQNKDLLSVTWNWGDGTSNVFTNNFTQNVQHTYNRSGSFPVTVTIVTKKGCIGYYSRFIYIGTTNSVIINGAQNFADVCVNTPIKFNESVRYNGGWYPYWSDSIRISQNKETIRWDFGDGLGFRNVGPNPTFTYTKAGIYDLKIAIKDSVNCLDTLIIPNATTVKGVWANFSTLQDTFVCAQVVSFRSNVTTFDSSSLFPQSLDTLESYEWIFGNNLPNLSNPNPFVLLNAGNYTVSLIASNTLGCKDSVTKNITIIGPKAFFEFVLDSIGCEPFTQVFNNLSSNASNYIWRFNDSNQTVYNTTLDSNTFFTYSKFGKYYPTLQAQGSYTRNGILYTCTNIFPDSIVSPYREVTVLETPKPSFTHVTNCQVKSTLFTNTTNLFSSNFTSFSWNFGDGNFSTEENPSHNYSDTGTYRVVFKIVNSNGCEDSITKLIYISLPPIPDFSFISDCPQKPINFKDSTKSFNDIITTWFWDFGDSSSSNAKNPIKTFAESGIYTVKMRVNNRAGCSDSVVKSVQVFEVPTSSFSVNAFCSNQNLNLANTSSINDTTSLFYNWSFSDGTNSNVKEPLKTFNTANSFTIKLKVTSGQGCVDSSSQNILIQATPSVNFTINTISNCLNSNRFDFLSTTNISAGSFTLDWDLGDATFSNISNPSKTYLDTGRYSIKLKAISDLGCVDSLVKNINVNPNTKSEFSITEIENCFKNNSFYFLDQTIKTNQNYSRKWIIENQIFQDSLVEYSFSDTGFHTVTLITSTSEGCTDTLQKQIRVFPMPIANYIINNQDSQCIRGNKFDFLDNSSISWGNYSLLWDFGDNTFSTLSNPSKTFNQNGNYKVSLFLNSIHQCKDTFEGNVVVHRQPKAAFTIQDSLQCLLGNSFEFYNLSSIDSGSLFYQWQWGDSLESYIFNPTKIYNRFGSFNISLIVNSEWGCSDTFQSNAEVYPMPIAKIHTPTLNQCVNSQRYIYFDSSIYIHGNWNVDWDFGNNSTSNSKIDSTIYTQDGLYTIRLIAQSDKNCSDTDFLNIEVYPKPMPDFSINIDKQCQYENEFVFSNTSSINSGNMAYQWKFGDGNTSSLTNPTNTYTIAGNQTVQLIATSNNFCKDSVYKSVFIYEKPVAGFVTNDTSQCINPNKFIFIENSSTKEGTINQKKWEIKPNNIILSQSDTFEFIGTNHGLYTALLFIETEFGCKDTFTQNIEIFPKPNAGFMVLDSAQCINNQLFNIQNTSTIPYGNLNYFWDFGDNTFGTSIDTIKTYNTQNTYFITLISTSSENCKDTLSKKIIVYPKPNPDFDINDTAQCLNGNLFIFKNTSTIDYGFLNHTWNLDTNVFSSAIDTQYAYPLHGNYKVRLISESNFGCIDTSYKNITVHPKPNPDFIVGDWVDSFGKEKQCFNGHYYNFYNKSTIDYGSLNYKWTTRANDTFIQNNYFENMGYSYSSIGFKQIQLLAISDKNCKDSITKDLRLWANPQANFVSNKSNQCINTQNFEFINQSKIEEGKIEKNQWDLGNGDTSSNINSKSFYQTSGEYVIRLYTESDSGCIDSTIRSIYVLPKPEALIGINDTSQCLYTNQFEFMDLSLDTLGITKWFWTIGKDKTSNTAIVNHKFVDIGYHNINLKIESLLGCRDTIQREIFIKPMPDPSFEKLEEYYCDNIGSVNIIPTTSGGVFYGKNIVNNQYIPRILWKDTIEYKVVVEGCLDSSKQITTVYPSPKVNLGEDTTLCLLEILEYDVSFWNSTYLWQDKDKKPEYTIKEPGIYHVTVSNICGEAADTIQVSYGKYNCRLYLPTAFSPNKDGINEYYRPITYDVDEYIMEIFNRWGELIYKGDQNSLGWDGTFQGKESTTDVYLVTVYYSYKFKDKKRRLNEKVMIHLIR
jgi:gliding motility-associated-like protein